MRMIIAAVVGYALAIVVGLWVLHRAASWLSSTHDDRPEIEPIKNPRRFRGREFDE